MATYIEIGNFLLWPPSYPSWVSGGRTYWWLGSYSCRSASQHVSLLQSEWHPDVLTADPDYVDRWVDASLYRGVQKSSTYRMWLTVTPLLNLCASLLLTMSFRSLSSTLAWLPWSWPPAFSLLWFFRTLGRLPRVHQSIESGLLRNGGATRRCAMC